MSSRLPEEKKHCRNWKDYKLIEPPIYARSNFLRDMEMSFHADNYDC